MKAPTKEKTPTQYETTNRVRDHWPEMGHKSLAPLVATNPVPTHPLSISKAKETLVALVEGAKRAKREVVLKEVEAALKDRADVRNMLCVRDCLKQTPGVLVYVASTTDSMAGLRAAVDVLKDRHKLFEVGLLEEIDYPDDRVNGAPGPVDELSEFIAKQAERGVMIHAMAPIRPGSYEELVTRQLDNGLLGTAPGRDGIQVFAQRVCDPRDKGFATAHSLVGACIGKRVALDLSHGMGEPMAGDRNEGDGSKGGLSGVALVETYTEEQRANLSRYGINLARNWYQVGPAVITTNRSLLVGKSAYIFASTTRMRQQVQAVFHETAERNVQNAGKREAGPLEKTMGQMNTYLNNLIKEGWISEGQVTVDYSSLTVVIHVKFVPVEPIDSIVLEYDDKH